MACNFLRGDRDQPFLLSDLRNWLPADHRAWFVGDVVDQLDLEPSTEPTATTGTPPRLRPQDPARHAAIRLLP